MTSSNQINIGTEKHIDQTPEVEFCGENRAASLRSLRGADGHHKKPRHSKRLMGDHNAGFKLKPDGLSLNMKDIVMNVDQSAYVLAESGGVAWSVYSRLLELSLYPVWSVRPLTFCLTNTYGNIATFSVKTLMLGYHLLMMWINFTGYLAASSCIYLLRRLKDISKWLLGSESEQYEVHEFYEMQKASNYAQWFSHAKKHESEKRAPAGLQSKSSKSIYSWRQHQFKSRRMETFHSPGIVCHSDEGNSVSTSDLTNLNTPDNLSIVRTSTKKQQRWNSRPLSVTEWRSFPMEPSFYPNLSAFRQFTRRLEVHLNYQETRPPGSSFDGSTSNEIVLFLELSQVQRLIDSGDISSRWSSSYLEEDHLLATIRTILQFLREWSIGRIGDQELIFGVSFVGTHQEIEEQQALIIQVLQKMALLVTLYKRLWKMAEVPTHEIVSRLAKIRRQVSDFQRAFGSTVLALSGGGRLALSHIGVIDALESAGCLPTIISGSSGGSVFAANRCCLSNDEYKEVTERTSEVGLELFPTLKQQMRNRAELGYNLNCMTIGKILRSLYGDITFEEAYQKTGRQLCITTTPAYLATGIRTPLLLNAVNTPNIIVWSAAVASCCLPILLPPVRLLCKTRCSLEVDTDTECDCQVKMSSTKVFVPDTDTTKGIHSLVIELLRPEIKIKTGVSTSSAAKFGDLGKESIKYGDVRDCIESGRRYHQGYLVEPWGPQGVLWCDGSLSSDIPIQELQRLYGANEVVCSQVNPHQAFFLEYSPHLEKHAIHSGSAWDSSLYYMKRFFELGVRQRYNKATQLLLNPVVDGQDISEFFRESGTGTITISPCAMKEMHKVAQAPNDKEFEACFKLARQRTWPHLPRILFRSKIEAAIEVFLDSTCVES
eukprot:GHVH01004361.1.p1 GENE.GHVH01004361.1~~GHVH01004361.1.p1  ORF type:complete len:884 (-),score=95.62 GHVH01004361.1:1678-4329(-)